MRFHSCLLLCGTGDFLYVAVFTYWCIDEGGDLMQTKCDVCKKDCACKGCTKNNTCKYVSNDQCKVVVTCGMRKSWADDIMKKFMERV